MKKKEKHNFALIVEKQSGETMSEGELKKLIAVRNRWDTELNLKTNLRLFDVDWKRMELLLDDAYKEYLSFTDNLGPPPLKGDKIDFEKWEPIIQEVNCKREKWFLKWLGAKPSQSFSLKYT